MRTVETVADLRYVVAKWRTAGERIALVPTMGNLHEGHLDLVRKARGLADRVIVSIFVNPLQFGENEDFAAYPRSEVDDSEKLIGVSTDLLFMPSVAEVYPRPQAEQTRVEVPGLSDLFCGASRAGHFVGVATVVCKLFNMAQPDVAVFGEKDYQQLLVIRQMVQDLCFPIEIHGLPTVREVDGLARSSRNGYLTDEERSLAPAIYRQLKATVGRIQQGRRDFALLEEQALSNLESEGFLPDYYAIRRARDLGEPGPEDSDLVILAAAYLGKARLIDNIRLSLD
ncbi:MAG: pantoate--beta-alanine ligase [Sedimenticola sp.]|nr:pantoate--beta-alanine ligase [Sedimenticola sp.]